MILRKCQKDAIDCFISQRAVATETNLSLCTGAGKSLIIRNLTQAAGRRILVFPWLDLLRQYWNEHKSAYASTGVLYLATEGTLPDVELLTDTYNLRNKSYVLLTTYTSAPLIFKQLGPQCVIDLLCHDEAHRIERPDYAAALTAVQKYIKHTVNLSATLPTKLVPHYKYSLLRGIHDGVVRDFHMRLFMCTVKERDQTALIITMIDSLLAIHGCVKLLIYTSEANTDGADASSVKTFMDVHADEIKAQGWWIKGIKADTRDRTTLLREFEKQRDVSILVSCKTLSEGIDLKGANCMLPWDPSNSTVENIQRIGRVLRLYRTTSGGIATDQSPSTILIPVFLDEDKYSECEGDREKINLLLCREISQAEKGDFKAIVNICTALKDELADDDPELFNRLVCGKSAVEINEDLLECIAENREIEKDELLDELADSLDIDEEEAAEVREGMWATDEERNMLDQIAENGGAQIVVMDGDAVDVFGDGEETVVIKRRGDDVYTLDEDETVDEATISKIRSRRHINQRLQYDFSNDCRIMLGIEEIEGAETVGDMVLMRLTSEVEADEDWEKRRLEWVAMYEKLGRVPSAYSKDLYEKRAGKWQSHQREGYKKKEKWMISERIIALEKTYGWTWNDNRWSEQLKNWINIYNKLGRKPFEKSIDNAERRAGIWQSSQRTYYKKEDSRITKERISILNATSGWTWEDDKWQDNLNNWINVYKKIARNPSQLSSDKFEKNAGIWQQVQRREFKNKASWMTSHRICILNNTPGWSWESFDNRWNAQLVNWADVYTTTGKFPSEISKNQSEAKAGKWASHQRQDYKKKAPCMTSERIKILESTPGWTWTADKTSGSASVASTVSTTSITTSEPEVTIIKRKRVPVVPTSASLEPAVTIHKRKTSTLEAYHKRFKTMNAQTYATAITPADFENYHKIADLYDKRDPPAFQPTVKVAKLLTKYNKPTYTAVDLGCGQNRLRHMSYVSKINWTSIDVHAVDDTVTVANMANLPFDEDTYDIAVLCRSLWAKNHMDVLTEVFRILKSGGRVVLCESFRRWLTFDTDTHINSLLQCLLDTGFEIIYEEGTDATDTETTDVFQYIVAQKP